MFEHHDHIRSYFQVVTDNGKLDKMRVVHESHPNAQEAITDYKVLGSSLLGELNQDLRSTFYEQSLTRSYTCGTDLF